MPAVAPGARLNLAAGAEEYEFHREISRWECRAIETTSFGSGPRLFKCNGFALQQPPPILQFAAEQSAPGQSSP